MIPLALFFFIFQDYFGYSGSLVFPYKLKTFFSSFVKNAIGILIGIALTLYIALGSMVILTILILLIQDHDISFHLFVSSSVSFISVFRIHVFASLGKFIPRYFFLLFDVMVNGIAPKFLFLIVCY